MKAFSRELVLLAQTTAPACGHISQIPMNAASAASLNAPATDTTKRLNSQHSMGCTLEHRRIEQTPVPPEDYRFSHTSATSAIDRAQRHSSAIDHKSTTRASLPTAKKQRSSLANITAPKPSTANLEKSQTNGRGDPPAHRRQTLHYDTFDMPRELVIWALVSLE